MGLAPKSTLTDPYCPLRAPKTSELRGCSPVLGGNSSSEPASETIDISSDSSSETIDSLIQNLVKPDYAIEISELDELDTPKTLAEAAKRLGLSGTQSASHRLTRLSTRFPVILLKNGKQLTALGWKLMQELSVKSVDELWEEYQSAIAVEQEPEPETVDVELMDDSEVGAAIVLRTQAILEKTQEIEPPTIVLGQHLDHLLSHYKAAGEQMGQQLGAVFQAGVAQGFHSVVAQGTIGGLK